MRRHWVAVFLIALTMLLGGCKQEEAVVDTTTATTTELASAGKEGDEAELDVTIVFLGLMSFDLTDPKAVAVYLPAVKQPVKVGDDDHTVDPHVAYLLATATSFDTSETLMDTPGGGSAYKYLPVDGESITIPDGQVISTALSFNNDGCGECPTSTNATRLCWLSSVKEVHGNAQKKSPNHFATAPDKTVIAARVPITHGTLAARVIKNGDGEAMVWAFQKPGTNMKGKPEKALAQEVHWTFRAKGTELAVNVTPYGSATARTVKFKPDSDNKVLIVIANTMERDIGPIPVGSEQKDEHYSIYHQFIENNRKGLGRIPVPANRTCKDASGLFDPTLPRTENVASQPAAASGTSAHAHKTAAAGAAQMAAGRAAPGGLNCTPNQWP